MPGDGSTLLRMPDIKLLHVLKITCKVAGDQQAGRKFDAQTIQPSNGSSCKANKAQQIKKDNPDVNDANSNRPIFFRSTITKASETRAR